MDKKKKGEIKNSLHNYFEYMAPDESCLACKKLIEENPNNENIIIPIEDTEHSILCESVPGKKKLFEDTWNEIKEDIRKEKKNDESIDRVDKLFPFLAATQEMQNIVAPIEIGENLPHLREIQLFPKQGRIAGLIPKGLAEGLMECGLEKIKAHKLAVCIARKLLLAEFEAHKLRNAFIREVKNSNKAFKTIVLQMDPPISPTLIQIPSNPSLSNELDTLQLLPPAQDPMMPTHIASKVPHKKMQHLALPVKKRL